MSKRSFSILLALALVAGIFSAVPAKAQTPVPAAPNIVDPANDANFINEGTAPGLGHDNVTPADASTVADLLAVWFSNTTDEVSVHFQTQAAPPASNGITYQAFASPGEGSAGSSTQGCLRFLGNIPGSLPGGGSYQDQPWIRLLDRCNVGTSIFDDSVEGEFVIEEGPDGTGITTFTFPRSYSTLLATGQTLSTPTARGSSPTVGSHTNVGFATPSTDTTKPGTDYPLGDGGEVSEDPKEEPPGKSDPPGKGKKKGCPKGKGKKKGACPGKKPGKPGPPVQSCVPYLPGEEGAEAETTVVNADATEEKPIEVTIAAPPGVPEVAAGHVFHNIQVDSSEAEGGLFARYEFPIYEDHDIYLNYAGGSEAAHAAGFNPTPVGPFGGTGSGGHSEQGAEQLDGIRSADCSGYTLDLTSYISEGGDMTLKLWLGEIQNDPAPPDDGGLETFYALMGIGR